MTNLSSFSNEAKPEHFKFFAEFEEPFIVANYLNTSSSSFSGLILIFERFYEKTSSDILLRNYAYAYGFNYYPFKNSSVLFTLESYL